MKVAFLLRGGVSYKRGKMRNPREEAYVNIRACYLATKKYVVDANPQHDIDFFIQSWNPDLKSELIELYKQLDSIFEHNSKYMKEMQDRLTESRWGTKFLEEKIVQPQRAGRPICSFRRAGQPVEDWVQWDNGANAESEYHLPQLSQALSIKLGIQLIEKYEASFCKVENNSLVSNYDLIVIYRPDVMIWKKMDLDFYDTSKIYCNGAIGSERSPLAVNAWSHGDLHFVMSPKNAAEFKYVYDSVSKKNPHKHDDWKGNVNPHDFNEPLEHKWIGNYIRNYMGKELVGDGIKELIDQCIIRRVWEESWKGHGNTADENFLTGRILKNMGLTHDEIEDIKTYKYKL